MLNFATTPFLTDSIVNRVVYCYALPSTPIENTARLYEEPYICQYTHFYQYFMLIVYIQFKVKVLIKVPHFMFQLVWRSVEQRIMFRDKSPNLHSRHAFYL